MNFGFHIFGNPKGRFTQWPDDETSGDNAIVADFLPAIAGRVLVIERNERVMSYVYCESLSKHLFLGYRLTFNSMQISKPKALMDLLSSLTYTAVSNGVFLTYNYDGEPCYTYSCFGDNLTEIENICQNIEIHLNAFSERFGCEPIKGLPESKIERFVEFGQSDNYIVELTYEYTRVIIYDNNTQYNSIIPGIVKSLRKRISPNDYEVAKLQNEICVLKHQKKRLKLIIGLMALLLGIGILQIYYLILQLTGRIA